MFYEKEDRYTYDVHNRYDFDEGYGFRRKRRRKETLIALSRRQLASFLVFCTTLSALAGFGGSYLARNWDSEPQPSTIASGGLLNDEAEFGFTADNALISGSSSGTALASSSKTEELAVTDIAALTADSVVVITTETVSVGSRMKQYVTEGAGSGVIVTADGYIVTNNHVIDGASKITVKLNSGKAFTATLIGKDSKTDLAVLKIAATGLQPVVMGDSSKLKVGELAVAVGNPLGELGGTVTDGIISALDRSITIDGETMSLLQTNAAINPGNSGGGLFNSKGELIGVVNAKSSGTGIEGLGFAIPSNTAKTVINQIISYGYVKGRVDLGMTLVEISDIRTALAYRVQLLGIYVSGVADGGSAKTAGIKAGDMLVSVNGTEINSTAQVTQLLSNKAVGDKVTVVVLRNGKTVEITMTLLESKS